jgi:hypothetical protein
MMNPKIQGIKNQNSSVFWVITQRQVLLNRRFGATYQFPVNVDPMGNTETSVSNHLTPRNQFNSTAAQAYDLAIEKPANSSGKTCRIAKTSRQVIADYFRSCRKSSNATV